MKMMSSKMEPARHHDMPKWGKNRKWAYLLTIFSIFVAVVIIIVLVVVLTTESSSPMPKIQAEYQEKANKIIKYSLHGEGSGKAYDWVVHISDKFGHRKIGSTALENAIDYNVERMKIEYGFNNVHTENVLLPNWTRGEERAEMISPRRKSLAILGLGSTVGTNGPLTAEAVVVTSWDDLQARCNLTADQGGVDGKIVVYNQPWTGSYGVASRFRSQGASKASQCGAVSALIRSAASFSINSPHTGSQSYMSGVKKIPAISLAVEDAELLYRIQKRGEKIVITLFIASDNNEQHPITSRNTIFEVTGSTYPDQMVMICGHFDSWDVGEGTMDNGGGASIALRAVANLKSLIDSNQLPRPKRTLRGIHWTAEEPGMMGSGAFYNDHKNDTNIRYVFLQEADMGFFRPLQIQFSGSASARRMFQEQIYPLLRPLNVSIITGTMGDADWWASEGVPGTAMGSAMYSEGYERYFQFHHSQGDTPTVYARHDLDAPTAIWAVLAYVIADMNETLPIGPRVTQ